MPKKQSLTSLSEAALTAYAEEGFTFIATFVAANPAWMITFAILKSLFKFTMANKQQELNDLVETIKDNPSIFRQDIVESRAFKEGFILWMENYLKIRTDHKKVLARNVLLGFSETDNKEAYELERINDALLKISQHGLETLRFLTFTILPMKMSKIREEVSERELKEHNEEWWVEHESRLQRLSGFVQQWLYKELNPNGERRKGKLDKRGISEAFEEERKKRLEINDGVDELISLGILRFQMSESGYDIGGGNAYEFTRFGRAFIDSVLEVERDPQSCSG